LLLIELLEEQNETIEAFGDMYENYNLVMVTSYGLPLGANYLRDKMQEIIDREGLPD
jgi:hypothetical protein